MSYLYTGGFESQDAGYDTAFRRVEMGFGCTACQGVGVGSFRAYGRYGGIHEIVHVQEHVYKSMVLAWFGPIYIHEVKLQTAPIRRKRITVLTLRGVINVIEGLLDSSEGFR